ncbi:MAG: hypothetical protein AAFQ98_24645 [Bacteroidota bacterium]
MNNLHKKIDIPVFLHELHGHRSSVFDLVLVYGMALAFAATLSILAGDIALQGYKRVLLVLLALDLAGGVVANFTEGTNAYYKSSPKRRSRFMTLHVIQPAVLMLIFPESWIVITALSFFTLLTMALINRLKNPVSQRVVAGTLLTLGINLAIILGIPHVVVHCMLILFMVKLIMAFAVRWD